MKIQIVEDDRAISDGILLALKEPDLVFLQSFDLNQAMMSWKGEEFDFVILDINLPDGNGYDYLKWVRERSKVPILILTANDMEMDEVMGFSLGADDYVTKPFSLAVLRARINALLRRRQREEMVCYQEDGFHFNFDKLVFQKQGREIFLSVNEQRLLKLLVENKERILTRSVLMDRIWLEGCEYVDENTLSVMVNRLRNKLEDKKDGISYIQTIYGQGYMWKKKT